MLEGSQGRSRVSWPGREGDTRSENAFTGSVQGSLLIAPQARVSAWGNLGTRDAAHALCPPECNSGRTVVVAVEQGQALACCLTPSLCPSGCLPGSLRRPDHRAIGLNYLLTVGAGVFELLGFAGVVKVAPHTAQVLGDPEVAIMLADNLQAETA